VADSHGQQRVTVELARGEADSALFDVGTVSFEGDQFTGGTVDFSEALDWSAPLKFDPKPSAV